MTDPREPAPLEVEVEGVGGSRRVAPIAALAVAVVLAALVALLATRDPSGERAHQSPLFGRLAPPTEGRTLDGGSVSLEDLRGRWVVVNFFASWCTPCRVEHPELQAFHEAHEGLGDAALVAVTYDNSAEDARAFFEERGGDWPVIDDPDNSIGVAYGVAQVPETFVVAPNGLVVHRFAGGVTKADLDEVIAAYEQEPETET
jgi:cytochrome c biogenesis protein CcmG/thiol:disulfide interchange protein DsbE